MAKTKAKKFTPVRNEEMHRAMVELRRSSAAQRHTVKSRKGTRAVCKQRAMREW